jgi:hypothetical protein
LLGQLLFDLIHAADRPEIGRVVLRSFEHDFIAWERDKYARPLGEYRVDRPVAIQFYYSEYQQQKLAFAYDQLGKSAQGVGMILRKHNPLFFVRETAYAHSASPSQTAAFTHYDELVQPGAA